MKAKIQKKIGGSSDLAVDPEKTKEPRRPADLRWKFYKDPSHGGGLRAALLSQGTKIQIKLNDFDQCKQNQGKTKNGGRSVLAIDH